MRAAVASCDQETTKVTPAQVHGNCISVVSVTISNEQEKHSRCLLCCMVITQTENIVYPHQKPIKKIGTHATYLRRASRLFEWIHHYICLVQQTDSGILSQSTPSPELTTAHPVALSDRWLWVWVWRNDTLSERKDLYFILLTIDYLMRIRCIWPFERYSFKRM